MLDSGAATIAGVRKLIEAEDPAEEPFETELVSSSDEMLEVKAIHRRDGLAQTHRLPAELFASNDYRRLVEVHAELLKQVGRPPFAVGSASARRRPTRSPSCAGASSSSPGTASPCSASRASAR